MLICPGWCGEEFVDADLEKNHKALRRHVLRCPKGHATLKLMERFAYWLQRTALMEGPDGESNRVDFAKVLAGAFMVDDPPTDPRVRYSVEASR